MYTQRPASPIVRLSPGVLAALGALVAGGGALVAGCGAHRTPVPEAPAGPSAPPPMRFPLPGLVDLACAERCVALTPWGYVQIPGYQQLPGHPPPGAVALTTGATGVRVVAPCAQGLCSTPIGADGAPEVVPTLAPPAELRLDPLAPAVEAVATYEAVARTRGWRMPFQPLFNVERAPVVLTRSPRGGGMLTRPGDPPLLVPVPVSPSAVRWPPVFAASPTRDEVYFLSWPGAVVRALDPHSLATRWTVELEGASHGLFVDPGGRWLLAGEGPDRTERFVDWPVADWESGAALDPQRDEALRALDRPAVSSVVVVDLGRKQVATRAAGALRRWLRMPGTPERYALATDREVVLFTPEEPR